MNQLKLYMILLGCKPERRFTEQHDIFFGIGRSLSDLKPAMREFWPEPPKMHIDAWREVTGVGEYRINVIVKTDRIAPKTEELFFINLGGYKENEFDEFHYKLLVIAPDSGEAVRAAKNTAFYQHTGFEGAVSHVDDKYGVDVDDIVNIAEILSQQYTDQYSLEIIPDPRQEPDPMHLGYLSWEKF